MRDWILAGVILILVAIFMPTLEQRWLELEKPFKDRHETIKRITM